MVRLLKVIRDENDWNDVASFFLENVCTNYCTMNGREFWFENRAGGITAVTVSGVSHRSGFSAQDGFVPDREGTFVNVLRDLEIALAGGHLKMTLFPRCNLFVKQKSQFRENAAGRLRKILRRLHFHVEEQDEDAVSNVLADLFDPRRRLEITTVKGV